MPDELREASYALGVPKWRTIVKVVLPTALAGIVTGITLAIARVAGETAPLLIIAGATDSMNSNLFDGRMTTLPVFIYSSFTEPGVPRAQFDRAWGAALVLIAHRHVLNLLARLIGRIVLSQDRTCPEPKDPPWPRASTSPTSTSTTATSSPSRGSR